MRALLPNWLQSPMPGGGVNEPPLHELPQGLGMGFAAILIWCHAPSLR
jgi:hypothetical protein